MISIFKGCISILALSDAVALFANVYKDISLEYSEEI